MLVIFVDRRCVVACLFLALAILAEVATTTALIGGIVRVIAGVLALELGATA